MNYHHRGLVIGGQDAQQGQFPFFANSDPHACGGTLIHRDIVLTAAHCAAGFFGGIWIGRSNRNTTDGERRQVVRSIGYPNYTLFDFEYDIMVFKLDHAVTSIAPIPYSRNVSTPPLDLQLTTMGFGLTEAVPTDGSLDEFPPLPDVLQYMTIQAVPDDICREQYAVENAEVLGNQTPDLDLVLCAAIPDGGNCYSNLGGPLLSPEGYQIGIVGIAEACAVESHSTMYTRVAAICGLAGRNDLHPL